MNRKVSTTWAWCDWIPRLIILDGASNSGPKNHNLIHQIKDQLSK
jgi:hypothetical protein